MRANEIIAIVEFLGDSIGESQSERLIDEIRMLSIADRERVLASLDGGILYSMLSEHRAEMGGFERY